MTGNNDATVKLLYITADGGTFSIDSVVIGQAYDVVADVEFGHLMRGVIDEDKLFVSIRNLSQSTATSLPVKTTARTAVVTLDPFQDRLRVKVGAGWVANEGDILEAVAAYQARYGANRDYSIVASQRVVVVTA